jgi:hypothetical protein
MYFITTYNNWTSTQYNIINDNTKFKGQLEVESVTASIYMCIYVALFACWIIKATNTLSEYAMLISFPQQ